MKRTMILAVIAMLGAAGAAGQKAPVKSEQVVGRWRCFAANESIHLNTVVTYAAEGIAAEHMTLTSEGDRFTAEAVAAIEWKLIDGDKIRQRMIAASVLYAEQAGRLIDLDEAQKIVTRLIGTEATDSITVSETGMLIGGAGSEGTTCVR